MQGHTTASSARSHPHRSRRTALRARAFPSRGLTGGDPAARADSASMKASASARPCRYNFLSDGRAQHDRFDQKPEAPESARFDPDRAEGPNPVAPLSPADWPTLWARCWSRIRSWSVPPRWSCRDWWDEARAQGALAAHRAGAEFDARRGVPREAFLYRRVIEA